MKHQGTTIRVGFDGRDSERALEFAERTVEKNS